MFYLRVFTSEFQRDKLSTHYIASYLWFNSSCVRMTIKKNKKNQLYGLKHFQSNDASPVFLLLDLQFQGQVVGIFLYLWISAKRWEIEQTLLLPSDRKSGICVRMAQLRMLDVVISAYISKLTHFEMWISRKRWALAQKCSSWLAQNLALRLLWYSL